LNINIQQDLLITGNMWYAQKNSTNKLYK
jgi:hypothetical protein